MKRFSALPKSFAVEAVWLDDGRRRWAAHLVPMKVVAATLENGLLSVEIVREIPEELKPRRINIGSGDAMAVNKQISQDVEKPRKVA